MYTIKSHRRSILSGLSALLLASFMTNNYALEKVIIGVGEFPPYTSQYLPEFGEAAKITTQAFSAVGIDIHYKWLPWKRVSYLLQRTQLDASIPWLMT